MRARSWIERPGAVRYWELSLRWRDRPLMRTQSGMDMQPHPPAVGRGDGQRVADAGTRRRHRAAESARYLVDRGLRRSW
jgi:hypothetical protein